MERILGCMTLGYYLKKSLGALVMPLAVIVIVLVIGLALLWLTRRQTAGKVLCSFTLVMLYVLSLPLIQFQTAPRRQRAYN